MALAATPAAAHATPDHPAATAAQVQGANPGVIPHQARYQGLTYEQWQARWWQWAISIPFTASHPDQAGGNVLQNQTGRVWFLAGVVGSVEVRSITIPSGIALFFPVVNVEC
jgi:hypothetical protein